VGRPRGFVEAEVVDRAAELFWREGYERTTMQDLVDAAGLGRASLYGAFGSKDALFERALGRYIDQTAQPVLASLDGDGPWLPRLRATLRLVLRETASDDRRGCMLVRAAGERAPHDDAVAEQADRAFAAYEQAYARLLVKALEAGELRADVDPPAAASLVLATVSGLQLLVQAGHPPASLDQALNTLLTLLAPPDVGPRARPGPVTTTS
jgi:TetR/AcrR family transcriptional repressor of nem operon